MSANVFEDLGFDPEEAREHTLRVHLALALSRFIKSENLSQREAAEQFGVPQPTVSKIVNVRLRNISLTLLIRMALRAGLAFSLSSEGSADTIHASVTRRSVATFALRIDSPPPPNPEVDVPSASWLPNPIVRSIGGDVGSDSRSVALH
jgi:predicted XRE-type DNA-binding protein